MAGLIKKDLKTPDETRTFEKGKVEIVNIGDYTFGLATFQPGWKWSESVKPLAKTDSCQASHTGYQVSGKLHVKMDDGSEYDLEPGGVAIIPPGHDAWVVGDEPVVTLDITGMANYAKNS